MAERYSGDFHIHTGVACSFYSSFYHAVTFGSGSGIAEIYYLNRYHVPLPNAIGIAMLKYGISRLSLFFCCGIYVLLDCSFVRSNFLEYNWYLLIGYFFTFLTGVIFFFLCLSPRLFNLIFGIVNWLSKKLPKWNEKFPQVIHQLAQIQNQLMVMQKECHDLVRDGYRIYSIFIFNFIKYTLLYMIPYVLLHSKYGITILDSLAMTSLIAILSSVIPAPAGIGSTEFVFTLLFSIVVGDVAAMSSALMYRLATFVFPFVIGAAGIVIVRGMRIAMRRWRA